MEMLTEEKTGTSLVIFPKKKQQQTKKEMK